MKQQIYYVKDSDKILYLMRGLPGSGKSTKARALSKNIYSTDDFFIENGIYKFDFEKLEEAHNWNQQRVKESMSKVISPIVIDNTNSKAWELKPYVKMGIEFNYSIFLVEPETEYKFNPKELAKRNIHNLTEEKIKEFLKKFEKNLTFEIILNSLHPEED